MNPNTQECFGLYGYGSGYGGVARVTEQGLVDKINPAVKVPSLCETCPCRSDCFNKAVDEHGENLRLKVVENLRAGKAQFMSDILQIAELPESRFQQLLREYRKIG
jgi:hypothetical protein